MSNSDSRTQVSRVVSQSITQSKIVYSWGVLLFLFIGFIWMVLATLSTFQIQSKILSTIDSILNPATQLNYTRSFLFRYSDKLLLLEEKREGLEEEVAAIELNMDDFNENLQRTKVQLLIKEGELLKMGSERQAPDDESTIQSSLIALENESVALENNLLITGSRLSNSLNLLERKQKELGVVEEEYSELVNSHPNLNDLRNELLFLLELNFDWFIKAPNSLLSLILTMAMGGLGVVIQMTREAIKNPSAHSGTQLLFRPCIGIGLAFTIFIMAKAGLLIISGSSGIGEEADDVNPFFISLLAIVSGMFSEEAYEKIRSTAENMFKGNASGGGTPPV